MKNLNCPSPRTMVRCFCGATVPLGLKCLGATGSAAGSFGCQTVGWAAPGCLGWLMMVDGFHHLISRWLMGWWSVVDGLADGFAKLRKPPCCFGSRRSVGKWLGFANGKTGCSSSSWGFVIRCASRKILADEGSNGFHSESLQLSAASDDPIKIYIYKDYKAGFFGQSHHENWLQ